MTGLVGAGYIKRATSENRKRRHRWFEILKPVAICLSTCGLCRHKFDPDVMTWDENLKLNLCPACPT